MTDETKIEAGSFRQDTIQRLLMEKVKYAVERHVTDLKPMSGTSIYTPIGPRFPDGTRLVLIEFRLVCNEKSLILKPKLVGADGRPS